MLYSSVWYNTFRNFPVFRFKSNRSQKKILQMEVASDEAAIMAYDRRTAVCLQTCKTK